MKNYNMIISLFIRLQSISKRLTKNLENSIYFQFHKFRPYIEPRLTLHLDFSQNLYGFVSRFYTFQEIVWFKVIKSLYYEENSGVSGESEDFKALINNPECILLNLLQTLNHIRKQPYHRKLPEITDLPCCELRPGLAIRRIGRISMGRSQMTSNHNK